MELYGVSGLDHLITHSVNCAPDALALLELEDQFDHDHWRQNRDQISQYNLLLTILALCIFLYSSFLSTGVSETGWLPFSVPMLIQTFLDIQVSSIPQTTNNALLCTSRCHLRFFGLW